MSRTSTGTRPHPGRSLGPAVRALPALPLRRAGLRVHRRRLSLSADAISAAPVPQPAAGPSATGADAAAKRRCSRSVYELHAANAASRLDQIVGYAGPGLRRLLMIANDAFLTDEARQAQSRVVALSSADVDDGALDALADALRCRGFLLHARTPGRSGGRTGELEAAVSGRARDGDCPYDRQPDGAAVPIGLVGVQLGGICTTSRQTHSSVCCSNAASAIRSSAPTTVPSRSSISAQDPGGFICVLAAHS